MRMRTSPAAGAGSAISLLSALRELVPAPLVFHASLASLPFSV